MALVRGVPDRRSRSTARVGVPVPLRADEHHDLDAMAAAITPAHPPGHRLQPEQPDGRRRSRRDELRRVPRRGAARRARRARRGVHRVRARRRRPRRPRRSTATARTCACCARSRRRTGWPGCGSATRSRTSRWPRRCARRPCRSASPASRSARCSPRSRPRTSCSRASTSSCRRAPRSSTRCARRAGRSPTTQANFVWLRLGERTAEFAAACAEVGLSVRAFDGEGVRVTIGEPGANVAFLDVAAAFRARRCTCGASRPASSTHSVVRPQVASCRQVTRAAVCRLGCARSRLGPAGHGGRETDAAPDRTTGAVAGPARTLAVTARGALVAGRRGRRRRARCCSRRAWCARPRRSPPTGPRPTLPPATAVGRAPGADRDRARCAAPSPASARTDGRRRSPRRAVGGRHRACGCARAPSVRVGPGARRGVGPAGRSCSRAGCPAYRDLRTGARGPDVAQLQRALRGLGYAVADPRGRFGPIDHRRGAPALRRPRLRPARRRRRRTRCGCRSREVVVPRRAARPGRPARRPRSARRRPSALMTLSSGRAVVTGDARARATARWCAPASRRGSSPSCSASRARGHGRVDRAARRRRAGRRATRCGSDRAAARPRGCSTSDVRVDDRRGAHRRAGARRAAVGGHRARRRQLGRQRASTARRRPAALVAGAARPRRRRLRRGHAGRAAPLRAGDRVVVGRRGRGGRRRDPRAATASASPTRVRPSTSRCATSTSRCAAGSYTAVVGPSGSGQVDAAEHARPARPADDRAPHACSASTSRRCPPRELVRLRASALGLRLPGLPPDPAAHRASTTSPSAGSTRGMTRARRRAAALEALERVGMTARARRAGRPPLRRRAPARRDRARRHRRSAGAAVRRADRQPRHRAPPTRCSTCSTSCGARAPRSSSSPTTRRSPRAPSRVLHVRDGEVAAVSASLDRRSRAAAGRPARPAAPRRSPASPSARCARCSPALGAAIGVCAVVTVLGLTASAVGPGQRTLRRAARARDHRHRRRRRRRPAAAPALRGRAPCRRRGRAGRRDPGRRRRRARSARSTLGGRPRRHLAAARRCARGAPTARSTCARCRRRRVVGAAPARRGGPALRRRSRAPRRPRRRARRRAPPRGWGSAGSTPQPAVFVDGVAFTVIGIVDDVRRDPDLLRAVARAAGDARARCGAPTSPPAPAP